MKTDLFVKNLTFFYIFAGTLFIFGIMGIALGLYAQFFRKLSGGELALNNSLLLYSVGLLFSALIHFGAFKTIKKLKSEIKES